MLQEVIELQNDAVTSIVSQLSEKDDIVFKAPTGSGKTYMMADLMDRVLAQDEDVVFIVSSLSKGDLAQQNYDKFEEYVSNHTFNHINPYMIVSDDGGESALYIPLDYNVYVLPRDLYKKKSKLKDAGVLANFLDAVTGSGDLGKEKKGKKIYLIKDECHVATNNLDELKDKYFSKTINCSATPKLKKTQRPDVQIKEDDAVAAHLIKSVKYGSEDVGLEEALDKFKEIQEKYQKASYDKNFGEFVNPCFIIQISNKDKAEEELEKIHRTLGLAKNQDLRWMLIVDKPQDCDTNTKLKKTHIDKWKEDVKKPSSMIDVIIFKMVITEGWDIPRACMLYQMRDSQSKQLDEQVIGRVRRNPKLLRFEKLTPEQQELVTTAHVWGVVDKEKLDAVEVKVADEPKIADEFQLKTTRLKRLTETNELDLASILNKKAAPVAPPSIFDLYNQYSKLPPEVRELGSEYITDIPSWFEFANNMDEIEKISKDIACDYDKNMEIVTDEKGNEINISIPPLSYYIDNGNHKDISKWLWRRLDGKEAFSFDSEAERDWCEVLLDLIGEDAPDGYSGRVIKHITDDEGEKVYLVGKNFLPNSEIKYEYYLRGIHASYPDYILKDYQDRIHLFESKCLNKSSASNIDGEKYEEKIKALQDCYKTASKLTGYYFYIPIKQGSDWKIWQYENGNEHMLSKSQFREVFTKIQKN